MSRGDNTLQRLYSARAAVAYAISLDGPIYASILDRIEREIALRRGDIAVCDRAASILDEPEVRRLMEEAGLVSAGRFVGRFCLAAKKSANENN